MPTASKYIIQFVGLNITILIFITMIIELDFFIFNAIIHDLNF